MLVESMAEAIAVVVRTSLAQRPDRRLAAGSTH
jgi:hypothetical protein